MQRTFGTPLHSDCSNWTCFISLILSKVIVSSKLDFPGNFSSPLGGLVCYGRQQTKKANKRISVKASSPGAYQRMQNLYSNQLRFVRQKSGRELLWLQGGLAELNGELPIPAGFQTTYAMHVIWRDECFSWGRYWNTR